MKIRNLSLLAIFMIVTLTSGAQTVVPGYAIESLPSSAGFGPVAVKSSTEVFASVSTGSWMNPTFKIVVYNPLTGVASDYITGVTDDDVNRILDGQVPGYIGGLYYDSAADKLYFTENSVFDTLLVAEDLNGDGGALSVVDMGGGNWVSEVTRVCPDGTLPFASDIAPSASSDEMLVVDAVGGGLASVVSVNLLSGATDTAVTGFDYNGGLAQHPVTGEFYLGTSSYPFPGKIYRLLSDADSSGAIELSNAAEADLIASVTGPGNIVFDLIGTLFVSSSAEFLFQITDTNSDNIPDMVEQIGEGFAYCGGMDFGPKTEILEPYSPGGTLFVSDPWAFPDSNIKAITGDLSDVEGWQQY